MHSTVGLPSRLPMPPPELRSIVGSTDERHFDNPSGDYVWGPLNIGPLFPGEAYQRVFDFGCGCGRNARQLMLQRDPPQEYLGIDVSRRLIAWCAENLTPHDPRFCFMHHDAFNANYAPDNSPHRAVAFPAGENSMTLVNAHSVFTHLFLDQTVFYLKEARRILNKSRGIIRSTWFLFNRAWFPMLQDTSQFCLFINENDPTQAVYYDWQWLVEAAESLHLKIVKANWTRRRGHQNEIYFATGEGFQDIAQFVRPPHEVLGF